MPKIILNTQSGGYPARGLSLIDTIVVHYSGNTIDCTPESVDSYHRSLGWPGEGYHFHIMQDGTIYQTQLMTVVSYHCGSGSPPMPDDAPDYAKPYSGRIGWNNWHTVGVMFTGAGEPTETQTESLSWLCLEEIPRILRRKLNIVPHKVISQGLTKCPGKWEDWWSIFTPKPELSEIQKRVLVNCDIIWGTTRSETIRNCVIDIKQAVGLE